MLLAKRGGLVPIHITSKPKGSYKTRLNRLETVKGPITRARIKKPLMVSLKYIVEGKNLCQHRVKRWIGINLNMQLNGEGKSYVEAQQKDVHKSILVLQGTQTL